MTAPKAIETVYGGRRYRSRTEARWAVFLDACGIDYEYEREGFDLPSGAYLPDFWLPSMFLWLEIKGAEPTLAEKRKCWHLAAATGEVVLLAIGQPDERFQILWFDANGEEVGVKWALARDVRHGGGYWLVPDDDRDAKWIAGGDAIGSNPAKGPVFSGVIEQARAMALGARFERGEAPRRIEPLADDPDFRLWSEEPHEVAA